MDGTNTVHALQWVLLMCLFYLGIQWFNDRARPNTIYTVDKVAFGIVLLIIVAFAIRGCNAP